MIYPVDSAIHRLNNWGQVISRRGKNENVFKMSKDEKSTCKARKNTVFHYQICKFVGFLLPSSLWLLKLPNTIILFFLTPKFCISIAFIFSWDHSGSPKEIKTMFMQNFWRDKQRVLLYF